MILKDAIRRVENARIELRTVASGAQGWADKQREHFDMHRMKPLDTEAARLIAALQKADEQCQAAIRVLAD